VEGEVRTSQYLIKHLPHSLNWGKCFHCKFTPTKEQVSAYAEYSSQRHDNGWSLHAHTSYSQSCIKPASTLTWLWHVENGCCLIKEHFALASCAFEPAVVQGLGKGRASGQDRSTFHESAKIWSLRAICLSGIMYSSFCWPLKLPQRPTVFPRYRSCRII
jgi:hypothetical protein